MSVYLPEGFEKLVKAKKFREAVILCIKSNGENPQDYGLTKKCKKGNRCGSGLCPVCVRLTRKQLMKFAWRRGFFEREWCFITIRTDLWRMDDGDLRSFAEFAGIEKLTDIPIINNLFQRLRRKFESTNRDLENVLLVVGSIETITRTVHNDPDGKPYHVHIMVSGLSKNEVDKCCEKTKKLLEEIPSDYPRSVDVKAVSGRDDVVKSLSYSIKQPFWKYSYYGKGKYDRNKQFPNMNELYELVCNYGLHKCTGRWFKLGIQERGNRFRLSKMKSNFRTENRKIALKRLRKHFKAKRMIK